MPTGLPALPRRVALLPAVPQLSAPYLTASCPAADAQALGKPLILEEFGAETNRDAIFKAAYQAVEESLRGGGPLKGALFWQFYAPGQVGWTKCGAGCLTELQGNSAACPASAHRPSRPLLPPQTASRGEGGGAGKFGVYPSSSTFQLVKANAAAVQQLAAGTAPGCSKEGAPPAGSCADKG